MINSNTNLICLIGHPVKHSFSPNIHNHLFKKYNLNYAYICFDVESNKLKSAIDGIRSLGIKGANVTIPHKTEVIKYLDEISPSAKLIGAVNTIKNENGKLIGYNTDGIGFAKSILDEGYNIKGKNIMILGSGGGSKGIAVQMALSGCSFIHIKNRTLDNAKNLCQILKQNFDIKVKYSNMKITEEELNDIDIIINTTPIGMTPNIDQCPIDTNISPKRDVLVCDIVYNPRETQFIQWAKKRGLKSIGGIYMLINQALESFNIWTGVKCDEYDTKEILQKVGV
ncbi:shikimate dehydrogenase [Alkalithermobacter paradoxus]|uniref:Shikimate dehydrogenase (NADP(+)) n=1 Tax=Alkalithermobacter paradoxus TaxID=29349 RepID=A0A1V4I6L9_9FIRM|nr:quinate/shikimate dehydrogenase [[Clostridium] thermoalcaliphilum]